MIALERGLCDLPAVCGAADESLCQPGCAHSSDERPRGPLQVPPASDEQDELKKQQLKELAILNGTYKENKQLLPVANKRMVPGAGGGAASNAPATGLSEGQQQHAANSHGGCNSGMGSHVMMQVMAQQMFLQQEQHKMNLRIGLQQAQQQAQQAMAARQQALSASGNNVLLNATKNANPHATNFQHNNNITSNFSNSQHQHHQMGNGSGSAGGAGFAPNGMNRNNFNGMGGVNNNINVRGRSNTMSNAGGRTGLVSGDAKPFVPSSLSSHAVDAQPFVPADMSRQQQHHQQQRGRSNSQGPPPQRSFSQGPPMKSGANAQKGMYARTPNKGRGRQDASSRDENSNPQWAASSNAAGAKGPSSPCFLTSMQTPAQKGNGGAGFCGNFARTESFTCGNVLDNSVDNGWGSSLPFDLGWEAGDASVDSSVNSSFSTGHAKQGSRSSPPGGRGAQRWHPYSRSPPKASPDFNSKVVAICTASFGGHSGQQGAYSLF